VLITTEAGEPLLDLVVTPKDYVVRLHACGTVEVIEGSDASRFLTRRW
jgi:hypothetical protein